MQGSTRRLYRVKRWMYRTGGPGVLARVMNRISAIQFSTGLLSPNRAMAVEAAGRRTGRLISFMWSSPTMKASATWCRCSAMTRTGCVTSAPPRARRCYGGGAGTRCTLKRSTSVPARPSCADSSPSHRVSGPICRWTGAPRWKNSSGSAGSSPSSASEQLRPAQRLRRAGVRGGRTEHPP